MSDRANTRETTAAHPARDRRPRDPPGTTPQPGPGPVQRGAGPAPRPRRGPAAGTMSPVFGRPQRAPRSSPIVPGARGFGRGGKHGDQKADPRTKRNRTSRGTAHEGRATRHTRSARRWPQPRQDTCCQATTTTSANTPHTKKAYGTRARSAHRGTTAETEKRKTPQHTTER